MAAKFNPLMVALLVGGALIRGAAIRAARGAAIGAVTGGTGGMFRGGGGGAAQPEFVAPDEQPYIPYAAPVAPVNVFVAQPEFVAPDEQPYLPYVAPVAAPIDWGNLFAGLGALDRRTYGVIKDPATQTIIEPFVKTVVPLGGTPFPQQITPFDLEDFWGTTTRVGTTFTTAYPGEQPPGYQPSTTVYYDDEYGGGALVPMKAGTAVIIEPERNLFAGLGGGDGDYFGVDFEFPAAGEDFAAWEGVPSSGASQPESASEDEQRTDPQAAFDAGRFDTFYDE